MVFATVAVGARLLLAAVFAAAGVAKLADRAGTRRAVAEFGAPRRFVAVVAIAVPIAELAVAGLLLPASTAVAGALGALTLLAMFSGAVAVSLARGRTPECHCFGQLHSAPASWKTLARNGVLAALAGVALGGSIAEPGTSTVAWLGQLEAAEFVAVAVAAGAAVLLAGGSFAFLTLVRSYGRVLVRIDRLEAALAEAGIDVEDDADVPRVGLEPGTPAPWFLAATPSGTGLSLDDLLAPGLPVLLLFTSPHCGPCAALLPDAARWGREHADSLTLAFASEGAAEAVGAEAREFELERVLVDEAGAIGGSFEASGTPSAVLIAADGTIASWVASGRAEIDVLLDHALASGDDTGLPIGAEVPAFELPSLEGDVVSLGELRGRDTVLLFWNPGCGYCRAMRDDLRAWESSANGVTPRLVVVSSGDSDQSRVDAFSSTVVLDGDFAASSAFGAGGTPMAVLVDAEGKVASDVVGGADAVLELLGRRTARPLVPSASG